MMTPFGLGDSFDLGDGDTTDILIELGTLQRGKDCVVFEDWDGESSVWLPFNCELISGPGRPGSLWTNACGDGPAAYRAIFPYTPQPFYFRVRVTLAASAQISVRLTGPAQSLQYRLSGLSDAATIYLSRRYIIDEEVDLNMLIKQA